MSTARIEGTTESTAFVSGLGDAARSAATEAVNVTAARLATAARDRTTQVYNVSAAALEPFLRVKKAGEGGGRASVTLQVRALPISTFQPKVRLVPSKVRAFGRSPAVTRELPAIALKLFRNGSARVIPGAFPLQQRSAGALSAGEAIRKRIGPRRDRLTGLRYVTFPKSFLERLLPDLQREAGEDVLLEFSAAWRNRTSRGRQLRGAR